jgi:hypothetical protein
MVVAQDDHNGTRLYGVSVTTNVVGSGAPLKLTVNSRWVELAAAGPLTVSNAPAVAPLTRRQSLWTVTGRVRSGRFRAGPSPTAASYLGRPKESFRRRFSTPPNGASRSAAVKSSLH